SYHSMQERAQAFTITAKIGVIIRDLLCFVLRQAGAQRFGERPPHRIQSCLCQLKKAADVSKLFAVEKQIRLRTVCVEIFFALQQAKRDKRIEKITGRARVQIYPSR